MTKKNRCNSCCNSNNGHSSNRTNAQMKNRSFSGALVSITHEEYTALVKASAENDIIRRMIAAESGTYCDTDKFRIILDVPDKRNANE